MLEARRATRDDSRDADEEQKESSEEEENPMFPVSILILSEFRVALELIIMVMVEIPMFLIGIRFGFPIKNQNVRVIEKKIHDNV